MALIKYFKFYILSIYGVIWLLFKKKYYQKRWLRGLVHFWYVWNSILDVQILLMQVYFWVCVYIVKQVNGKKVVFRDMFKVCIRYWIEEVKVCNDELIYVIICDYEETSIPVWIAIFCIFLIPDVVSVNFLLIFILLRIKCGLGI